MLIAVTSSDAVNVLACQAGTRLGVPLKIARVEDPALRDGLETVGVDVVIDPASVRCDDTFASFTHPRPIEEPDVGRPVAAEFAAVGMIRLAGEGTCWTVDVAGGRLCRTDVPHDVRFLGPDAWAPMIALCVTHDRLVALTADGRHVSERRARREYGPDVPPRPLRVA